MADNEDNCFGDAAGSKRDAGARRRRGRPSRLTPGVQTEISELLGRGLPIAVAAAMAKVSASTVQAWRAAGRDAGDKQKRGERLIARDRECLEFLVATNAAMARSVSEISEELSEVAFKTYKERTTFKTVTVTEPDGSEHKQKTESTEVTKGPNLAALLALLKYRSNNVDEMLADDVAGADHRLEVSDDVVRLSEAIGRARARRPVVDPFVEPDDLAWPRPTRATSRDDDHDDNYYEYEYWEHLMNANGFEVPWWEDGTQA
jgi:hypothetical protein